MKSSSERWSALPLLGSAIKKLSHSSFNCLRYFTLLKRMEDMQLNGRRTLKLFWRYTLYLWLWLSWLWWSMTITMVRMLSSPKQSGVLGWCAVVASLNTSTQRLFFTIAISNILRSWLEPLEPFSASFSNANFSSTPESSTLHNGTGTKQVFWRLSLGTSCRWSF